MNTKASPPWELLWQTLTSQWLLFYSQCNRAEWAHPYAVSHWCASFQPTLFLDNRCSSGLAWCLRWPHSQAAKCPWVTIRCPSQLLISTTVGPAPSYCQEGSIGELIKERWCGGHQLESERRGRFRHSFGGPGDHPALGHWWVGGPKEYTGDNIR